MRFGVFEVVFVLFNLILKEVLPLFLVIFDFLLCILVSILPFKFFRSFRVHNGLLLFVL